MHVVLGVRRHVEVEDVTHILDVEAARGDVAADQQPQLALPEAIQYLGPLRLRQITVQRVTPRGLRAIGQSVIDLATAEGLRAHAESIAVRLSGKRAGS